MSVVLQDDRLTLVAS